MKCETLHLKEIYPFLGGDGRDAVLDCYLPYNMPEMHREAQKRKTLLICPGGGYYFVSEREGSRSRCIFSPRDTTCLSCIIRWMCTASRRRSARWRRRWS